MRGFLGFLVFAGLLIGVLVFVVVPLLVRPLVVDAVRAALPFGDQAVVIDVDMDGLGLLQGQVARVRAHGSDVTSGEVRIGDLDIAVARASIGDRRFETITGTLTGIELSDVAGTPVAIDRVTLSGSSDEIVAIAILEADAALALVTNRFAEAGLAVDGIQLDDGRIAFQVLGQAVQVPLAVEDGVVVVPDLFGSGSVPILTPDPGAPWELTAVTVSPAGMTINAVVDGDRLLAGT